ncbi:J domain-containing protein [Roseburia sp. MSJ-14]|uniref:J domain-containing protein n=1 Tax=Roseburia sp. MSJ-14 TaxID=2841514 RepID=UPI001C100677|nr:J domain-containing protein [Roseburia sp. MSJ-14]MBU5474498.1 hypothetical protein [Roseburia sp. MSJ-14]
MGRIESVFEILGIEPTKDIRAIKKAYAVKVKSCHPEEEPELWKKLHDAYDEAIRYAKGTESYDYYRFSVEPIQQSNMKAELPKSEETLDKQEDAEKISKSKESTKENVNKEDELNKIFGELEAQGEQKKQQLKLAYEKKLDELAKCLKKQSFAQWKKFLEDPDFVHYCQIEEFWKKFFDVLIECEMDKKTIHYVVKQMEMLEEQLASAMKLDKVSRVRRAKTICREKEQYLEIARGKIKIRKKRIAVVFALILLGLCIGRYFMTGMEKTTKEIVANLNEKYGENRYSKEDFQVEKLSISDIYGYKGELKIYKAQLKTDTSKVVYYLSYKNVSERTVLQLDNFQQEEITAGLQQELVNTLGTEKGMIFLSASDPKYFSERFNGTESVYSTKYNGDIKTFFEQEKSVREKWIQMDKHASYKMLDSVGEHINGRCAFWFPDKGVADVRQRLENPQNSYGEEFCQAVKNIEETYGIKILAAALPQSYYESMEQAVVTNEHMEKWYLTRTGYQVESEAPRNIPFVTTWYTSKDFNATEVIKQQQNMYQNIAEVQGEVSQGKSEETKASELHSIEAQMLEEGIYLFDTTDDVKTPIHGSVEYNGKEISITCCSMNSPRYMLILDMDKLGIEENNYYVKEESDNGEADVYKEYPYTAVGEEDCSVWKGEGLLFIPCTQSANANRTTTYTIVLESVSN